MNELVNGLNRHPSGYSARACWSLCSFFMALATLAAGCAPSTQPPVAKVDSTTADSVSSTNNLTATKVSQEVAESVDSPTTATEGNVDAEVLLRDSISKAAATGRKTFVIIGAEWCGWCKKLERFTKANSQLFSGYEVVSIDCEEMVNGATLSDRLIDGRDGGLPWTVILDKDAKEIACSVGSMGNVGFPVAPGEVGHFIEMIRLSSDKSPEQLDEIKEQLVQFEKEDHPAETSSVDEDNLPPCPDLAVDPAWQSLSDTEKIWIDQKNGTLIVGGQICLRDGPLEFFACPPNTKEYESVIVVDCKSFKVHAGLLAVGIKPGRPVKFGEEYRSAEGPVLDITVEWDWEGERKKVRAQELVKHLPTDGEMPYEWVFAGSSFWKDEETGEEHYHAEGGELICLSNFSTATIDLPVESSQQNSKLIFSAFEPRIPPLGTKVYLRIREKEATVE